VYNISYLLIGSKKVTDSYKLSLFTLSALLLWFIALGVI